MDIKSIFEILKTDPRLKEIRFIVTKIKKSPLSIIGLGIVLFLVIIAIIAPIIAPPIPGKDPYMIIRDGFSHKPRPPNEEHIFGTSEGQYDIYYGCIWGTRRAFYVSTTIVTGVFIIGVIIGCISGYFGGILDEILMRITDILFAIPGLMIVMALVVAFGPGTNNIIWAYIIVGWPLYARLMRSEVIRIKEEDFVEAAKSIGCSDIRIIIKHIVPNTIFPILIMASLDMGAYVLGVASLTFLGLGAPFGYADWGQMIAFSRNWILGTPNNAFEFWYTFTLPGIFIFVFVLGWNLLGDAFRDILDPTVMRR